MKIYFLSSVEIFLRKISLGQMFSLSLSLRQAWTNSLSSHTQVYISKEQEGRYVLQTLSVLLSHTSTMLVFFFPSLTLYLSFLLCSMSVKHPLSLSPLFFFLSHNSFLVCLFYRMFSLYKAPSIPIPYVCLFLLVHLHTFCYVKHTLAKFLRHIGTGRF